MFTFLPDSGWLHWPNAILTWNSWVVCPTFAATWTQIAIMEFNIYCCSWKASQIQTRSKNRCCRRFWAAFLRMTPFSSGVFQSCANVWPSITDSMLGTGKLSRLISTIMLRQLFCQLLEFVESVLAISRSTSAAQWPSICRWTFHPGRLSWYLVWRRYMLYAIEYN